jgi:cell division protein FtsZ
VDEVAGCIREAVDENAEIIFGATIDKTLEDTIQVSVAATGLDPENSMSLPHRNVA